MDRFSQAFNCKDWAVSNCAKNSLMVCLCVPTVSLALLTPCPPAASPFSYLSFPIACLTVSMALAASFDCFPLLTVDVVEAVAREASLGRGVLIDMAPSNAHDLASRCRSGRPAVSSSRLGWPMSLLAAGLKTCCRNHKASEDLVWKARSFI